MSTVADRRNQLVWSAIKTNNLKQALQLCTKRIGKGEKGEYLQALRASILLRSTSAVQREDGLKVTKSFLSLEPPVTDLETLKLIQQCLEVSSGQGALDTSPATTRAYIGTLWERAVKADSLNEELARSWFFTTFHGTNWHHAQKAAMMLQKSFPVKREYYFWAILCSHLLSDSKNSSEAEHKFFGMLAYRLIHKAAEDVPKDPDTVLSPGRAVQTPQELHLLLSIYIKQGYKSDAVSLLESNHLGINSSAAKGDWNFVRRHLDLLETERLWSHEWKFCYDMLKGGLATQSEINSNSDTASSSSHVDDWRLWKGLVTAARELPESDISEETRRLIMSYLARAETSRNAGLAFLELLDVPSPKTLESQAAADLLAACISYFDDTSTRNCCFDDLRSHFEHLDESLQDQLVKHGDERCSRTQLGDASEDLKQIRWISAKINVQKLRYLQISQNGHQDRIEELEGLISDCIKLYTSALPLGATMEATDNRPGDDACLLAVMSLVQISKLRASTIHLFQAASLLDFMLQRSKHNYQALLMLVRVYLLLGAGSLAFQIYPRLAIKKIQSDTLSHYVLTRISTLHPGPVTISTSTNTDRVIFDPKLGQKKALEIYVECADQVPKMCQKALEKGSYDQIEGFLEFGNRVENSICKSIWALQCRQIERLLQAKEAKSPSIENAEVLLLADSLADNRDFDIIMNCEASTRPPFEHSIQVGPTPRVCPFHFTDTHHMVLTDYQNSWVLAMKLCHQVTENLTAQLRPGSAADEKETTALGIFADSAVHVLRAEKARSEMTKAEYSHVKLHLSIAEAILRIWQTIVGTEVSLSDLNVTILQWLKTEKEILVEREVLSGITVLGLATNVPALDWKILHESFLLLDGLKTVKSYLDSWLLETSNASASDSITEIKQLVEEINQIIRIRAAKIKNQVFESGVLSSFVDATFGRDTEAKNEIGVVIEHLTGETWVETFVSGILESWSEALDGLLRVKIA